MNLLQKYNEYENARSELIADMRKLRNEISDYIDSNELEDEIHYSVFCCDCDPKPDENSFDVNILGGNLFFDFSRSYAYDDFDYNWVFTYQPHWGGLSVEEIVADIVKQSKNIHDLQRKQAIDEVKIRAEELGISVSVNTGGE